jgi:penicillin-binding protein-related factor A (putative recombinase)
VGGPPHALSYRGKGKVDFVGHVLGVPVAFDAKSNNAEASYHHDERDYHELDFLLDWRARGGVSFLLVLDRSIDTLYLVDDVARLRAGANVQLRTHARGRVVPAPVVPAIVCTEAARLIATVKRAPVWPWLQIAAPTYPAIARALGLEPRRPPDVM